MKLMSKLILTVILLILVSTAPVLAENIKIATVYWGTEDNTYQDDQYGLKLNDSQPMKGIYLQSIDTEKYQWNLFLYQTNDINYSDLTGVNFIYDYYFGANAKTKKVIGIGANYLQLDMAGQNVPTAMGPLPGFDLNLDTTSLYVRAGQYYISDQGPLTYTLMP